ESQAAAVAARGRTPAVRSSPRRVTRACAAWSTSSPMAAAPLAVSSLWPSSVSTALGVAVMPEAANGARFSSTRSIGPRWAAGAAVDQGDGEAVVVLPSGHRGQQRVAGAAAGLAEDEHERSALQVVQRPDAPGRVGQLERGCLGARARRPALVRQGAEPEA